MNEFIKQLCKTTPNRILACSFGSAEDGKFFCYTDGSQGIGDSPEEALKDALKKRKVTVVVK